jgi:hypothetical protein
VLRQAQHEREYFANHCYRTVAKLRLKPPSDGPASQRGQSSLLGGRRAAATKTSF